MPRVLVYPGAADYHSDPVCSRVVKLMTFSLVPLNEAAKTMKACPICHPEQSDAIRKFFMYNPTDAASLLNGGDVAVDAVNRASTLRQTRPFIRPSATQLRQFAQTATDRADSDKHAFYAAFRESIHAINPDYDDNWINLLASRGDTLMFIWSPVRRFQDDAAEAMRKMLPISDLPISDSIAIAVTPNSIDGPDIERIVVKRNGVIVQPIGSTLSPKVFTTKMGVRVTLHAGAVRYPLSAFEPGPDVTVVVTGIAASGDNLVRTLSGDALRQVY